MDSTTKPYSRWVTWIMWIAVLAPIPYGISRLLWAAGVPAGIDGWLLRDLGAPGWRSAYILLLALLSEATAAFTHAYVLSRRSAVPRWVPLLGGRRVRPQAVIASLMAPITTTIPVLLDGFRIPDGNAGLPAWSSWGQLATFWVWGLALTVATFAYWRSGADRAATRPPIRRLRRALPG